MFYLSEGSTLATLRSAPAFEQCLQRAYAAQLSSLYQEIQFQLLTMSANRMVGNGPSEGEESNSQLQRTATRLRYYSYLRHGLSRQAYHRHPFGLIYISLSDTGSLATGLWSNTRERGRSDLSIHRLSAPWIYG